MKTITLNQLTTILANKLELSYETDNFKGLWSFVDEIWSQFGLRWKDVDEMVYRTSNANVADFVATMATKIFVSVTEEVDCKFDLFRNELYCNGEICTAPSQITEETVSVDTTQGSTQQVIDFWLDVCKRFNTTIVVEVGSYLAEECGIDANLKWHLSPEGITAQDCYINIPDDNGQELMYNVWFLMECFREETFAQFEQLGVELRYEQVAKE